MKKSYSEIPEYKERQYKSKPIVSLTECISFCIMCFIVGFFVGLMVDAYAHAQTPETHDSMPIKSAAQLPTSSKPSNYPDHSLTPGVTRTVTMKELCTPGSTRDARHVTAAMKKAVFERYGLKAGAFKPGAYEIDHFISLENGGANDVLNLWPQIYCPIGNDPLKSGCYGAREKDRVETALHRWVCKGQLSLHDDQAILQADWIRCYRTLISGKVCAP